MTRSEAVQLAKRTLRANRSLLLVAIAYFLLATLYGLSDDGAGPLSPSGHVDAPMAFFLLAMLGLRLVVLFVVPTAFVYRLVRRG